MNWTARRKRFRAILAGDQCVHPGSVYDPISARIAEDLGFETGMFAGSTASLAVLGAPDLIVLTLSEFAAQCYRINRAGNLPLMVDADHGYGNALNVKRTVEECESAGVRAIAFHDCSEPASGGLAGPHHAFSCAVAKSAAWGGDFDSRFAERTNRGLGIVSSVREDAALIGECVRAWQ